MRLTERDERRFWTKVALPNGQGCMLWLKSVTKEGYGQFSLGGRAGGMHLAHRISYVLAYGEIPDGLVVDHVKANGCTNRHCVAPEHLEAVTQAENVQRSDAGLHQTIKTHCPQNHAYDEENTYRHKGRRDCRACNRAAAARYRTKRRAA